MQLHKIQISPILSFTSPLHSDTLFGAFCWSYVYQYGENALQELLETLKEKKPAIIFSNAFPSGTLPIPCGTENISSQLLDVTDKLTKKQLFQKNKKYKGYEYVKESGLKQLQKKEKQTYMEYFYNADTITKTTIHNMIDRNIGAVQAQSGGASLFDSSETYVKSQEIYDVYILSNIDVSILKSTIDNMFLLGIGGKKSSGKGGFKVVSFHTIPSFPISKDANCFMALSNFIPASGDPANGKYNTFVKYGKLDREYGNSQYPFKKPLLFIKSGAVFFTNDFKPYYGRSVTNVAINQDVLVNGYTIAYPLNLEDENAN